MLNNFWLDWTAWWATVTPVFVFLLALPFAVAAAGLLGDLYRNRSDRSPSRRGSGGDAPF